ncbi:4809_t:CDS:1, partial [Funneliformis mosseae]
SSDNNREDIIHLDQILNLDIPEILKDLDELIEDLNIDLEEETNDDNDVKNDTIEANSAGKDWDSNLVVEAYL